MSNKSKDNKLEKIYTPDRLTNHLLDLLDEYYKGDISEFLEPTAGSGQMIDVIKSRYNKPVIAFDIFNETKRKDIVEQDFLKLRLDYKKDRVTIMNPPFANGLKMVYKALEVSDFVVTILSCSSWSNFDYEHYDVELIEVIKKQIFSDNRGYAICIMVIKNKLKDDKKGLF